MRLRSVLAAPLLMLCACATEVASRAELIDLRNELRASRDRATRLERRVEMLETTRSIREGASAANSGASFTALPSLTVVKLKPKIAPAPKLDTRTQIVEPGPELLDSLQASLDLSDSRPEPANEDPALVQADYDQSLRAIRVGNVDGGAARLEAFAEAHPKHPNADNALYYAGLARMGLEDYDSAAQRFERIEREYPAGDAVADALLKLAECRMRLNRPADAKALYSHVAKSFPGTPAASQARARLAMLKP